MVNRNSVEGSKVEYSIKTNLGWNDFFSVSFSNCAVKEYKLFNINKDTLVKDAAMSTQNVVLEDRTLPDLAKIFVSHSVPFQMLFVFEAWTESNKIGSMYGEIDVCGLETVTAKDDSVLVFNFTVGV